jgi:predicted RNase H-like nuclease
MNTDNQLVVGIDVGGTKKGFHLATMIPGTGEIQTLDHCQSVEHVLRLLSPKSTGMLVAIDCPPKAQILGPNTRLAERQLRKQGFKPQWTRRPTHPPQEWMQNGQALWEALATLPYTTLIETFPTVATAFLNGSSVVLPLNLLAPHADLRQWKDFVDAAICAEVGDRYLKGKAHSAGHNPDTGEHDELGPIWF